MKEYEFDVSSAVEGCTGWIRDWFDVNGRGCRAVIGISGGKDSSVAAAMCVRALGRERVFGVLMPNGEQSDIRYSEELCTFLGIDNITVNISDAVNGATGAISGALGKSGINAELSRQSVINLPPRIRMSVLYAVSQSVNGRVVNTCNLSEDWVGYSTRYGDSVGDMSPLSHFTVAEVRKIGKFIGLPDKFIQKPPSDGLSGKTDEDNLGFTYEVLDSYIREGTEPAPETKEKIDRLYRQNMFKLEVMQSYNYFGK